MATLKLTLFKAKVLKDGRHKIRVAVCHKHETCYIVTNFVIDNESQFRNGQVVKRPDASMMNKKLRNLLNEYQDKLDGIKNQHLYSCSQLKNLIISASDQEAYTFQRVCNDYNRELIENKSPGYAYLIEHNKVYFTEFAHGEIMLQDITPEMVGNYSKFLRIKKKLSEATVSLMMRNTKTIINRGIKKRFVKYDVHPFVSFTIPSAPVREADISVLTFNKIRNSTPIERKFKVAKELFLLSFYLGGINLIDLLQIDFRNRDKIEYVRTKSRNTKQGTKNISFSIPNEAKEIICRWINPHTGMLDFGYKFSYKNFSRYMSRSLAALAKSLGITEKVIYYSARKSFAQYASEIGIPDSVIDYCLGHSDKSKGVIRYYTKVKQQQADIAISRVIDYVNNPDKYREYIEMRKDIMMMRG